MSRSVKGSQPKKYESGRLVLVNPGKFGKKLKARKSRRDWKKESNADDDRS